MAGDFFRGFMQGFAPVVAQTITQSAEAQRQRLLDETEFLQKKTLDPNASQAERDAALYALTQLASSKKPGKGLQAYEKKVKETAAAEVQGVGGRGPYGMVAGQPAPGAAGAAGGPMGAPGAAALPATSPIAGSGSAVEDNPEGKDLGPPPPPAAGPGGAPPAPSAAPARPDESALLAKGAEFGMVPPQRLPRPEPPNTYTARKLDLDFYKQDMLEHRAAEERYVDYLNRIAQLVYQEKKQKESQSFETSERLATQEFRAKESELERKSEEKRAGMRVREQTSAAEKEATLRERQALTAYRSRLYQIEHEKGAFDQPLKPEEKDARRREAAEIYKTETGKDAPAQDGKGKDEGPPPPDGAYFKKGVITDGPPPPPARGKDLDKLPAGPKIRSVIEDLRRAKLTPEQICAKIKGSPSLDEQQKAAARAYARCPGK